MRRFALVLVLAGCGDNTPPGPAPVSGARLQVIGYRFADGTVLAEPAMLHDAERGQDCRVTRFSSGVRHCMPVEAGGSTVFTDERCTQVLGVRFASEPDPTYFIRYYSLRGEVLPSRLYRRGAPTTPPAATWRQQDGECLGPLPPDELGLYHEVGEEIGPEAFAEIRTVATIGDARLSLALDGSDDGWRGPGTLTDLAADAPCTARGDSCVPDSLPVSPYYGDASCTSGLASAPRSVQIDTETGCTATLTAQALHDGTVYERIGESCVAAPPESDVYDATSLAAVAFTRTATGTGRLRPLTLAHGPITLATGDAEDTELGGECHVETVDGQAVCVPVTPVTTRTVFSDAGCVSPILVAFVPTGACERPAQHARDGTGVRPIGALRTAPIYELTTGDRCAAYAPPTRFEVHEVGDVVDPARYARALRIYR